MPIEIEVRPGIAFVPKKGEKRLGIITRTLGCCNGFMAGTLEFTREDGIPFISPLTIGTEDFDLILDFVPQQDLSVDELRDCFKRGLEIRFQREGVTQNLEDLEKLIEESINTPPIRCMID